MTKLKTVQQKNIFQHPFFVILGIITILYTGYKFGVFIYELTH